MVYKFIEVSRSDLPDPLEKLGNLKYRIQLHYNLMGEPGLASRLKDTIDNINQPAAIDPLIDRLVQYCQIEFKREWEKVKEQAGKPKEPQQLEAFMTDPLNSLYNEIRVRNIHVTTALDQFFDQRSNADEKLKWINDLYEHSASIKKDCEILRERVCMPKPWISDIMSNKPNN